MGTRATAGELWVVDPRGLSSPELALLASLQGNVNRTQATLWVRGVGANAWLLEDFRREGWSLPLRF